MWNASNVANYGDRLVAGGTPPVIDNVRSGNGTGMVRTDPSRNGAGWAPSMGCHDRRSQRTFGYAASRNIHEARVDVSSWPLWKRTPTSAELIAGQCQHSSFSRLSVSAFRLRVAPRSNAA
jgi:hypothetical protein